MPAFTVSFSFLEPQSRKGVYFKQDGQRFGTDRTIKFCTAVKYEIRVTVKPPAAPLQSLIIGGDELTPDSEEEQPAQSSYLFTWFTNGYTPTGSRRRLDVPFIFRFEGTEFTTTFQTKFYPVTSGSHLTWGTEVKQIQLEGRGEFGGGAMQTLTPTNVTFV